MEYIYKMLDSTSTLVAYGCLIAFCLSGMLVTDVIVIKCCRASDIMEYYTQVRVTNAIVTIISMLITWAAFTTVIYFCIKIFSGAIGSKTFFKNTAVASIVGCLFCIVEFLYLSHSDFMIRMNADGTIATDDITIFTKQINVIMYFVLSLFYILIVKYTFSQSWLNALLYVATPICVVIWISEFVSSNF